MLIIHTVAFGVAIAIVAGAFALLLVALGE